MLSGSRVWRMEATGSTYDSIVTYAQLMNNVGYPINAATASSVLHLVGNTATPIISADTGAGSGAVCAITGSDLTGKITITIGTSPVVGGNLCGVFFNVPFPNGSTPFVLLSPHNANAKMSTAFGGGETTGSFTIFAGSTPPTTNATYEWVYLIAQPN